MKNYNGLKKKELVLLLTEIHTTLKPAIEMAEDAGNHYSNEVHAQSAFQLGWLQGRIKSVVEYMEKNN